MLQRIAHPPESRPVVTRKQKGLGLGLEALLGPQVQPAGPGAGGSAATAAGPPRDLPLARLQAGRYQPRSRFDDAELQVLAESIRAHGVMQPIVVRPVAGAADRYEIVAGERRFRAASLAGLAQVPVVVREVDDQAAAAMALIENIQRRDLGPLEEARGLKRLVEEFGLTHEAAAQAVGRSRSAASNLLRLLQLAEPVQKLLDDGALEMGHARALLPLSGARQVTAAHEIIARQLTARDAERLAAREAAEEARAAHPGARSTRGGRAGARPSAEVARVEQRLADLLAAPVSIRVKDAQAMRGEIAIGYASLDELNGLLAKLGLDAAD